MVCLASLWSLFLEQKLNTIVKPVLPSSSTIFFLMIKNPLARQVQHMLVLKLFWRFFSAALVSSKLYLHTFYESQWVVQNYKVTASEASWICPIPKSFTRHSTVSDRNISCFRVICHSLWFWWIFIILWTAVRHYCPTAACVRCLLQRRRWCKCSKMPERKYSPVDAFKTRRVSHWVFL